MFVLATCGLFDILHVCIFNEIMLVVRGEIEIFNKEEKFDADNYDS